VHDNNSLKQTEQNINVKFENEMHMQKLREDLAKSFSQYQETLKYLAADAPIEILCLPKSIETLLLNGGCLRVYDVFNMDLAEIEGIGPVRLGHLTTCLNQFFSML
jgi:hypothetical protein